MSTILLLLLTGNKRVQDFCSLQWHNVHTRFNEHLPLALKLNKEGEHTVHCNTTTAVSSETNTTVDCLYYHNFKHTKGHSYFMHNMNNGNIKEVKFC